jgi:sulfide:quinone oxidoreductase|mmetsp:Transcript_14993/g.20344  ORF Transcript_14993/g.20344 Transcript_14993/m.20344 type:complete len:190 (+) Transcript_14993:493-1062(+)
MYRLEGAYKTSVLRESFKGGNALFTSPKFPIKCGGAPQKILYLCEEAWRKSGVRDRTSLKYYAAVPVMFPPNDEFSEALNEVCLSKGIEQNFMHDLTSIDKDNRVATFTDLKSGETVKQDFDFLHFVPPQSSPAFIRSSPLAHESGWLDVDIGTLRHTKYANIFGHGDVCNLPTSKTAAAIYSQTPVLV